MESPAPTASNPLEFQILEDERIAIAHLQDESVTPDDGSEVVQGLTRSQKSLPPRYLYDDRGSQIFEQICTLPEYYPTRTETAILQQYAEEIARMTGSCELIELGSGSSTKTRILLDAYTGLGYSLRYIPIDVSAGILIDSARALVADYPTLEVLGMAGTYEQGLRQLPKGSRPARTIAFLGSTLGNFSPEKSNAFFAEIVSTLSAGDYFLLGIDSMHKPREILEAAYADAAGVTAEFNFNLLDHLNRRFAGNIERSRFEHWSFYNPEQGQIETYMRSKQGQTIRFEALDLTVDLEAGEAILTEVSRKFDFEQMQTYLAGLGLKPLQLWTDEKQWYGLILCQMQK